MNYILSHSENSRKAVGNTSIILLVYYKDILIYISCWNLNTSESRSEMLTWNFLNVVLERDGEDQLDRSCEKWRSVIKSQREKENPTKIKWVNASWIGHILRRNCIPPAPKKSTLLKERKREGEKWREDEEEDFSSYWMTLRKRKDAVNWKTEQ